MADEPTYTRTEAGNAEAAAPFSMLRPALKDLLGQIEDGDSFGHIRAKAPKVSEDGLRTALAELIALGHVEATARSAADADITRYLTRPIKEPTMQQRRQAEQQTLAGLPSLRQTGYYVNILSRPPARIPPRSGDKYHVLIIDADERNTLVAARTLLLAGFDTRVAGKREEIVVELNRRPAADVIAMDVMLPDVIGLELLSRLREHPVFKPIPIIVMTGKAEHDDVVAALAYGASGYMMKPFKPEALLDSVEGVLGLN